MFYATPRPDHPAALAIIARQQAKLEAQSRYGAGRSGYVPVRPPPYSEPSEAEENTLP